MGSPEGVRIGIPVGVTVTEFCLDDICTTEEARTSQNVPSVAGIPVPPEPQTYRYRLTVEANGGLQVHVGTVRTTQFEVNGPGCGATAYARILLNSDGTLWMAPES